DLVGERDRDDLRMFVTHELGNRARVHPLQCLETLARASEEDAIDDACRLVLAERADQHFAQVLIDADTERGLLFHGRRELIENLRDLLTRDVLQLRHCRADSLHVLRTHVLHHFGGLLLAERKQQDRGTLRAAAHLLLLRRATHRYPPTISRLAQRAPGPDSRASALARFDLRSRAPQPMCSLRPAEPPVRAMQGCTPASVRRAALSRADAGR